MSEKLTGTPSVLACVTEIVSAHLSHNAVPVSDVPAFIRSVHATLLDLERSHGPDQAWPAGDGASQSGALFRLSDVQAAASAKGLHLLRPGQSPAVAVEDSVQPGYIVCLEDGKRLRMLKRYLRTHYGMTPEDYRSKWNLPADYPMAAPEVVEQRRAHAMTAGLGRKPSAASRTGTGPR